MENKITLVTIIYNEEKLLERCLKSVAGVVDKIMVFHDGECLDNSLEIAKKFTQDIFILPRRGYIEAHMSDVLRKVSTDWVLVLDADEYLSEELRQKIKELVLDEKVDAYSFLEPIYFPEKDIYLKEIKPRRKNCLLRLSNMQYVGFMHTGYETKGNLVYTDYVLEHKPLKFNFTWNSLVHKWTKLADRDAAGYFVDWGDIPKFNYNKADIRLSKKKKIKKKYPLLIIPFIFLLNFFRVLFTEKRANLFVLRYAFLLASYEVLVCYKIRKYKDINKK